MVVPQHAPQPLSTANRSDGASDLRSGFDQAIAQTLMIPFAVIMVHELFNGTVQRHLSEEDHAVEVNTSGTSLDAVW
jgi:hypothetical protein